MRRLFSIVFYLVRYAILSATLVVIGGFVVATFAGNGGDTGPSQRGMLAATLVAALLLPAYVLPGLPSRRRRRRARRSGPAPRPSPFRATDGREFEHRVAQKLEAQGWRADVTSGTGDQGIDIIARRDGRKIGIQCKHYVGAVGNKAVQEAFSGRAYHRVDMAVVITTGHYTPSARALARRTGVHLLHVKDIPRLRRLT